MKVANIEIQSIFSKKCRVLDLGCGPGWAVVEAAGQGAEAFGADVSISLLQQAVSNTQNAKVTKQPCFLMAGSDAVPFLDASFDLIICTELIEHTFKTAETLSEINRLLKPGGQCIFSFPVKWVENLICFFEPSFMKYSGHVRQFSLGEMKNILKEHGLTVVKTHRKYFEWSLYWLFKAICKKIPQVDRTGNQYGQSAAEPRLDYYYKHFWRRLSGWKIGLPVFWLGNLVFPKSHVLLVQKR